MAQDLQCSKYYNITPPEHHLNQIENRAGIHSDKAAICTFGFSSVVLASGRPTGVLWVVGGVLNVGITAWLDTIVMIQVAGQAKNTFMT